MTVDVLKQKHRLYFPYNFKKSTLANYVVGAEQIKFYFNISKLSE